MASVARGLNNLDAQGVFQVVVGAQQPGRFNSQLIHPRAQGVFHDLRPQH